MINRRIIIIGIVLLILIAGVGAYTIGQIITQAQLDSYNVETLGLYNEWGEVTKERGLTRQADKVIVEFTYDTVEQVIDEQGSWDGTYRIIQVNTTIEKPLVGYYECRKVNDAPTCKQMVKDQIKLEKDLILQTEERKIKQWQTDNYYNEFDMNMD